MKRYIKLIQQYLILKLKKKLLITITNKKVMKLKTQTLNKLIVYYD